MGIRITPMEDSPTPIPGNTRLACWCYQVSYIPVGAEPPGFTFNGDVRSGVALDFPGDVTVEEPGPYRDVCPAAMDTRSLRTASPARRWVYPGVGLEGVTEFTVCFVASSMPRGQPFPISVHTYRFVRRGDRTVFVFSDALPVERGTLPVPGRTLSFARPESDDVIVLLAKYEATKFAYLASQISVTPPPLALGSSGVDVFPGERDESERVDFFDDARG